MAETKTEKDLRAAIRAIGRDAQGDAIRRSLIARATKHDLAALIPDGWNADGTLKDTRSAWTTDEQRDTANDVFAALDSAVADAFGDSWSTWVQDWYGSGTDEDPWTVVYRTGGELYSAPYTYDEDSKIVLGEPIKVRPVTSYIERTHGARREWRRKKAAELKGLERRRVPLGEIELRADDDGGIHLTGYASVTERSYDVGFYSETIKRGAFKRTIAEDPDVTLLLNHEGLPLARTRAGTLRLSEDDRGLRVEADLDPLDPDTQTLQRKMVRGDLDGQMSFAFQATNSKWNEDYTEREISAVSLHRGDVSIVTQGANPATSASIRSAEVMAAIRRIGVDGLVDALTEWRDHTLQPSETRGVLSDSGTEALSLVLGLAAGDDDGDDRGALAELLGVDSPTAAVRAPEPPSQRVVYAPDHTTRARAELDLLDLKGGRR